MDYQSTYQSYRKAIDNSERSREQIADMCAQYKTLYRSLCHIHRLAKEGATVKDPNGRAYNRTARLRERRKMMQRWADFLDSLLSGANVIAIKSKAA